MDIERSRRWRRARRALAVVLVGLVVLTGASLAYNAATVPPRTLEPLSGQYVDAHGVRAHVQVWDGPGRPVLLVHGFAESTAAFEPMARELARTHRVVAMDMAGSGYSEFNGRYALADQVSLVDGVITALGLDRPVLVGHSLGAAVVGATALAHPERVGGVIFLDGDALPFDPDNPRTGPRGGMSPLDVPYAVTAYRLGTRSPATVRYLLARSCHEPCRGLSDELVAAWARPFQQHAMEEAFGVMMRTGMLALTRDEIRAISVPRAIVWGEQDPRSGGSLDEARRNLGHPPERIIPGAGHISMVHDPALCARFLDELASAMP